MAVAIPPFPIARFTVAHRMLASGAFSESDDREVSGAAVGPATVDIAVGDLLP